VERLWFVALDTARLRQRLRGAPARAALRALAPSAEAVGVRLVDACIVPCGMRAILVAHDRCAVRAFVRRFAASAVAVGSERASWGNAARFATIARSSLAAWRSFVQRCRHAFEEIATMSTVPATQPAASRGATTQPATRQSRGLERGKKRTSLRAIARKAVPLARAIEVIVDAALGADDCTARLHRYVADHDAPADDSVAFGRLCEVVFTQGIGIAVVIGKREPLHMAFDGFDPRAVAAYTDTDVRRLLAQPIIRNEAKIRACIENARRWQGVAAGEGSYLARIARVAAGDDASAGWPALCATLVDDFVRVDQASARHALKRWGFFTASPHPGSRRVVERLGLVDADAAPATAQLVIGSIADALGRDPYAIEGTLSLFAALGPCRPVPACAQCALADRCPTGSRAVSLGASAIPPGE
jgi:3-methyladenine DNA glycosylase Tag